MYATVSSITDLLSTIYASKKKKVYLKKVHFISSHPVAVINCTKPIALFPYYTKLKNAFYI